MAALDTTNFSEFAPHYNWMYRGRYYAYDVPSVLNALDLLIGTEPGKVLFNYSHYELDEDNRFTSVIRSGKNIELTKAQKADIFNGQNRSVQMLITVHPANGMFFRRITVCSQYDKDGKHMYRVKSKTDSHAVIRHGTVHDPVMQLLKDQPLKRKQLYDRTWICQTERYLMALNDYIRRVTHGGSCNPAIENFHHRVQYQLTLVNSLRRHKVDLDLRGAEDPYAIMMALQQTILLNRREPTKEYINFPNVLITENGVRYAKGLNSEKKYFCGVLVSENKVKEFHELLGDGTAKLLEGPEGYIDYLYYEYQRGAIVQKREVLDVQSWEIANLELAFANLGDRGFEHATFTNDGTVYATMGSLDRRLDAMRILNEADLDAIVHRTKNGKWGVSHYSKEYSDYLRSRMGSGVASLTCDEFNGLVPHQTFASEAQEVNLVEKLNDIPKPPDDQWLKDQLKEAFAVDETGQTWLSVTDFPPIDGKGLNSLRALIFRAGIVVPPDHRIESWEDFEFIIQLLVAGLSKTVGEDQGVFSGYIGFRGGEPEVYKIPGDSWSTHHDDWTEWNACSNEVCAAKHQQDIIGEYDLTFTHDMTNKQDVNDVRWLLTAADVHMYKTIALEKYPKRRWILVP